MDERAGIPEISPEEAKRLLEGRKTCVYLDVRTVAEYVAGHPPGALNVPLMEVDPRSGQMELNEAFLSVVRGSIPCDSRVIVGCQSGGRSAMATQMMLEAGYKSVTNMAGGFGGVVDYSGQVLYDGWSTLGYPVERGEHANTSYTALLGKASALGDTPT